MLEIRKASGEEFDKIAALHAASWRKTYRGIYSDQFLDHEVESDRLKVWRERFEKPASNQQVFVAIDKGIIIGFACIFLDDDQTYGTLLDNLHVAADYQRSGIGKALMKQCAKEVIAKAVIQSLYLWVYDSNENAKKAYSKLGGNFAETVDKVNEDGSKSPICRVNWQHIESLSSGKTHH